MTEPKPPSLIKWVVLPLVLLFVGFALLTDPKGLWQFAAIVSCWIVFITYCVSLVCCLCVSIWRKCRSVVGF